MTDATHALSLLDDRWLTPKEAAAYLSVQIETLAKWRQRGHGPLYSAAIGKVPRYRVSDLVEFMSTKMAANTREAKAVRRETASVIGVRYTARRQTRPVGRRA